MVIIIEYLSLARVNLYGDRIQKHKRVCYIKD